MDTTTTTSSHTERPLAEQVQAVLQDCPHVRNFQLSVMELPHAIVIGGTVISFYQKQMAQETVRKFLEPKAKKGLMMMLRNDIVVRSSESAPTPDE